MGSEADELRGNLRVAGAFMEDGRILPAGTVIGGKYEVLKVIGRGGTSVVYLVRDTHIWKNWAMKEVRSVRRPERAGALTKDSRPASARKAAKDSGPADDEIIRQERIAETEMLKKLSHPNLPRIVDVIDGEEGFYIVMDYIEGKTLRCVLSEDGAQPEEKVRRWAKTLAGVLLYLHTRNPPVIFRDVKPANIMLKPDGDVVLFDFGIARECREADSDDTVCLGTPGYAAPEQFGGYGQTDMRTDIYSLGATMYHLVTGQSPAKPPFKMVPVRRLNPALSPGIERIILKCTKLNPAERYRDCAEILHDLAHCDELDAAGRRRAGRKLAAFAAAAAVGILGLGMTVCGFAGNKRERSARYVSALTEVNNAARNDTYTGKYNPEIVNAYADAIEIDPSREEAYLRLLDYCESAGHAEAALAEISPRIDAGSGRIDKNSEIVYRTAALYFAGSGAQMPDYAKAEKYFSMIDGDSMPAAAYYAALAAALSAFSADNDWKELAEKMEECKAVIYAEPLSAEKVANEQLLAGLYVSYKQYFAAENGSDGKKIDPYRRAEELLLDARQNTEELMADQTAEEKAGAVKLLLLKRQVLADLAGCYKNAGTISSPVLDYDKAIRCYTELIGICENDREIRQAAEKIADCVIAKGDARGIRSEMAALLEKYPDDAYICLAYASFLYEENDSAGAAEMFRRAEACPGEEGKANMETLRIKLKNAGAI